MRTVYGVFAVPKYLAEGARVDSTWDNEPRALAWAEQRSIQVPGQVVVLRWRVNSPDNRTVAVFVDGERVRSASIPSGQ